MLSSLLAKEPVLLSLLGSTGVYSAIFGVLEAYNVQFTPRQIVAWTALFTVVGAALARRQVTPVAKGLSVDLAKVGQP